MAGEKRSASQTGDGPSSAKKSKPARGFPSFEDSDISIDLGGLELKLHRQTLRDNCKYFADSRFPVFCFGIQPRIFEPQTLDSQTFLVRPLLSDAGFPVNDDLINRAYAANKSVFRLIYRQPLACVTPADFRDVAALTVAYGCVDTIREALATAILRAGLGTTLFRDDPWALLKAADSLQDETIFSEALVHIVGRGLKSNANENISDATMELVTSQIKKLEAKVSKCWEAVTSRCKANAIKHAITAAAVRSYLDRHVPCALGSPLRPEVYRVLLGLHHMDSSQALVQPNVLSEVDDFECSLRAGKDAIVDLICAEDRREDMHRFYESNIDQGLALDVTRSAIMGQLKCMLDNIKRDIKPLFVNDRNTGYFTCVQFKGPFPWKSSTTESK